MFHITINWEIFLRILRKGSILFNWQLPKRLGRPPHTPLVFFFNRRFVPVVYCAIVSWLAIYGISGSKNTQAQVKEHKSAYLILFLITYIFSCQPFET